VPDSRQIDARFLVIALAQLLAAESLMQKAIDAYGADTAAKVALAQARDQYLESLPGVQAMRNALIHPEDWALGTGRGEQRALVREGVSERAAAAHFWGFGYDAADGAITMGPYLLEMDAVIEAAHDLCGAIYRAARTLSQSEPPDLRVDP
jgi:hypothetical protein